MDCIGSHEAPDVLWGAADIGRAIGRAAKATFHLLEAGHLPARKIGGRWCASRRKLLEALIGEDGAGGGVAVEVGRLRALTGDERGTAA
jgi:hypothetical protein